MDRYAALWRLAAAQRSTLCLLLNPAALPLLDRLCATCPDTTVVVDHLARIGMDGQIRGDDVRNLCALARHPGVYVKVSAFYALGLRRPPYTDMEPLIRRVYDAFGPDRLMWGSDAPFQLDPPHDCAASLELVRDRLPFLGPRERDRVLRGNGGVTVLRRAAMIRALVLLLCSWPAEAQPEATMRQYLERVAAEQLAARRAEVGGLRTKEDWDRRRAAVRGKFLSMMGGLPSGRSPLRARTTGTLDRGDYRVEKIVFESLPGLPVTANLYIPQTGRPPYPAVLHPTGHSTAAKKPALLPDAFPSVLPNRASSP